MITVDKGIPAPETHDNRVKYPFRTMEIGDSFVVEKNVHKVSTTFSAYNWRMKPKRFTWKQEGPDRTRVWRVA